MSIVAIALSYQRLLEENETLRMLRADSLALMASTLGQHLGSPGTRVATHELHEWIDGDLEMLSDHLTVPRKSAQEYCDDWRNAGILIRRPKRTSREETYELSAAGLDTLRILEELRAHRSTLTESRLVAVTAGLHRLAVDTDPDPTHRLAVLREERDRLDAEIERIQRAGDPGPLNDGQALERAEDILMQAQSLPADLAHTRERLEKIHRTLRTRILDPAQGTVVDDIFRGVDLIAQSEVGRAFLAFSATLSEPERRTALDQDLTTILDRDFIAALDPAARQSLRCLARDLRNGDRETQQVLTNSARDLRHYVLSEEFARDSVIRALVHEALGAAVEARTAIKPFGDVGLELEISAMPLFSAGEVVAHDPTEFDAGRPLDDAESSEVDFESLEALARESEIDFSELASNVNETIRTRGPASGIASVAQVLAHHPATQGLASVIGLLSLATQQGEIQYNDSEVVRWRGGDGVHRAARVTKHVFTREVEG